MIKSTPEADKKFDKRFSDSDGVVYQNHHTLNEHISSLRKQDIMSLMEEIDGIRTIGKEYGEQGYSESDTCFKKEVLALLETNLKLL